MIDAHLVHRVLDAASAGAASFDQSRLMERLPPPAKQMLESLSECLRVGGTHTAFASGETLLLAVDVALGDGSGSVLERAGRQFASLYLTQTLGGRLIGDVAQCLERLRRVVLDSFHYPELSFEVTRATTGLNLEIRVGGAPRAARILRYLSVGFIQAAFDFALETSSANLRVFAETTGDRCSLTARYRLSEPPQAAERETEPEALREPRRTASRLPAERSAPSVTPKNARTSALPRANSELSLAAEVERILGPSRLDSERDAWAATELPYTIRVPRAPRVPVISGG